MKRGVEVEDDRGDKNSKKAENTQKIKDGKAIAEEDKKGVEKKDSKRLRRKSNGE